MCIEVMLNAANLNFVAGALHHGSVDGWVFTAVAIAIAAAGELQSGLQFYFPCTVLRKQFRLMKRLC